MCQSLYFINECLIKHLFIFTFFSLGLFKVSHQIRDFLMIFPESRKLSLMEIAFLPILVFNSST